MLNQIKKFFLVLLIASFVFQISGSFDILAASKQYNYSDPKIEKLRESLKETPNFLQYTEYKMLQYKNQASGKQKTDQNYSSYDYSDYSLKPSGSTPLSTELTGGMGISQQFGYYGDLSSGIDVLTGTRAIDESTQLGSIGVERENVRITSDRRQIELALELYYDEHNGYPESLSQLSPKYLPRLPAGFSYRRKGNSYELKFGSLGSETVDIFSIEPLSLKSHSWESMIKGEASKIPDIFSLAPADYFAVYFRDMDKFTELEKAIQDLSKPSEHIYNLKDMAIIKDKIFKRLGIRDIKELRKFVEEMMLVSYDLSPYPNTDYALVLKVKISLLNNFISDFIEAPSDRHGKVGDYYVIATDAEVYKKIAGLVSNKSASLAAASDIKYVLSALEKDYDGFAYFSEALIQKLTGPVYRLNARRRNTIMNALETLQYIVFAYRDIAGQWPKTIRQVIDEKYIAPNSVANIDDYAIDSRGIVKHKDWNSIYDATPIDRVPIANVISAEREVYESFREGYQQFWREFIDPVGIAILVGDQIRFHTIILPLIEETQYNWLKDVAGKEPIAFDFVFNPDRIPSFQISLKLNIDDILYAYYKSMGKYADEEYTKCTADFYKNWSLNRDKRVDEVCKFKEKSREEAIASIKTKIAEFVDWKERADVLGFIGDEMAVGVGNSVKFKLTDFTQSEFYLGLELTDTDLAKKFVDQLFKVVSEEFLGARSGSSSGNLSEGMMRRFLGLDSPEPIKNSYNGVDFYMIPTGFTNVFYMFFNNRFYLTLSQKAINGLIDSQKEKPSWDNHMLRLFDYLGERHNVMAIFDGAKLQTLFKDLVKEQLGSYFGMSNLKNASVYYTEALVLAKTLSGYNGSISNVQNYYRYAPEKWLGADLIAREGKLLLRAGDKEYEVGDIETSSYPSYYYNETGNSEKIVKKTKFEDVVKNLNIDALAEEWTALKSFGVGLTLADNGLDIRVVFNNPQSKGIDSRVSRIKYTGTKSYPPFIYFGGGAALLIIIAGGAYFFLRKRRLASVVSSSVISPTVSEIVSESEIADKNKI